MTMIQSTALATSRTRYGLREPKIKAENAKTANNQRNDKHASNLEASSSASDRVKEREMKQI